LNRLCNSAGAISAVPEAVILKPVAGELFALDASDDGDV
jgi:hypothetical protein